MSDISVVVLGALLGAAVRSGLDIRSALDHVGAASGGDASSLCTVSAALGMGVEWDDAWSAAPSRFEDLARALAPAWKRGSSPVDSLAALSETLLDNASAAGEAAAGELGVRVALPLALCLMPAFILVGIVPLLIALVGSVMAGSTGVTP
jgi:tight adherence protein B